MQEENQEVVGRPEMDPDSLISQVINKPSVEDLQVLSYQINDQTTLEWRGGGWAVCTFGMCLNSHGKWEYEPRPSDRTEEFIARTRYPTPQDGVDFYYGTLRGFPYLSRVEDL